MTRAIVKMLIFSLANVRFVVDLDHVVEVLEHVSGRLDMQRNDLRQGIVAALGFRHTTIPVIDPTLPFGLLSDIAHSQRSVLVLRGSEGNWAILVDRVEGLVSTAKCSRAHVPALLRATPGFADVQVMLVEEAPLMVFEPEHFYGINQARP